MPRCSRGSSSARASPRSRSSSCSVCCWAPSASGSSISASNSGVLATIATLALVLVLFTDAVSINVAEVRRHRTLALLVLGPGTLLTAALVAVAAWALLDVAPAPAAILGAPLASTDPVIMRGRRPGCRWRPGGADSRSGRRSRNHAERRVIIRS
ncbi:MAG: cation:proton antiporter [Gemmatimonadales bacterium]